MPTGSRIQDPHCVVFTLYLSWCVLLVPIVHLFRIFVHIPWHLDDLLFLLLSHLTHTRLVIIIYDSIGEISPGLEGLERQHQPIDTPAGPTKATNRNVYQEGARTRAGQRRPWAHREVRPVFCFCCCFVFVVVLFTTAMLPWLYWVRNTSRVSHGSEEKRHVLCDIILIFSDHLDWSFLTNHTPTVFSFDTWNMIRAAKWSLQELERKYNVALEKTAMLEGEVVTKNALAEDVQRLKDELRGKGTLLVFFFSIGFTSRDTQQLTNGWLAFIPPVKLLCS